MPFFGNGWKDNMGRLNDNSVFNTVFEMFLHVILILFQDDDRSFSLDEIVLIDFIASYSADFGLGHTNLHSNNPLRYSEITAKRHLVDKGIKKALFDGMIYFVADKKNGFTYQISETGYDFACQLETSYSTEFQKYAKAVISLIEKEGFTKVQRRLLDNARKGGDPKWCTRDFG